MSYILDALKRSQQEREIGQVPTLETSSYAFEEDAAQSRPLVVTAVVLAALALVIALYSVLRGGLQVSEPQLPGPGAGQGHGPESPGYEPTVSSPLPSQARTDGRNAALLPGAPQARPGRPAPSQGTGADASVLISQPEVAGPSRREEPEPVASEASVSESAGERGKVPPDLIADIEAFKREVNGDGPDASPAAKGHEEVAPQDLRLPKEVRARLPEFVLTAHVYDAQPSKRFVLIDGLKAREGEESRAGIVVEQILPDGALLVFEGHRFFEPR